MRMASRLISASAVHASRRFQCYSVFRLLLRFHKMQTGCDTWIALVVFPKKFMRAERGPRTTPFAPKLLGQGDSTKCERQLCAPDVWAGGGRGPCIAPFARHNAEHVQAMFAQMPATSEFLKELSQSRNSHNKTFKKLSARF